MKGFVNIKKQNDRETMRMTTLTKEELCSLNGGKTAPTAQGFPCRVVESDGSETVVIVQTIQECLDIAYP